MGESFWPFVISKGDSHVSDFSASLKEFFNSPSLSSESKVTHEEGVGLSSGLRLETTWPLSRELNLDILSIKILLISTLKSISCCLVLGKLNESFSLGGKELALGKLSIRLKESSQAVVGSVISNVLDEEF